VGRGATDCACAASGSNVNTREEVNKNIVMWPIFRRQQLHFSAL
jgi:hypothetical protein